MLFEHEGNQYNTNSWIGKYVFVCQVMRLNGCSSTSRRMLTAIYQKAMCVAKTPEDVTIQPGTTNECPFCNRHDALTFNVHPARDFAWGSVVCSCGCSGPDVETKGEFGEHAKWHTPAMVAWIIRTGKS